MPKPDATLRRSIRAVDRQMTEMNLGAHLALHADKPAPFQLTFGETTLQFEFGARAFFRMGIAEHPFELTDCANPKRASAATITWLWACLCKDDAESFDQAEDLAALVPIERLGECVKALGQAVAAYNANRKANMRETAGATPAKSPAKSAAGQPAAE